jgi:signal transduction histidine kinase/CheY-like chemotaxis protein
MANGSEPTGDRLTLTATERVDADLINSLFQLVPRTILGVLVGAVVVVWFMWGTVSQGLLLLWLSLNLAYAVWRVGIYRVYRGKPATPLRLRRWKRIWVAGTGTLGLIWGSAGIFMLRPESPELQALLAACLFAIAVAALPLQVRYLPGLYAFTIPVLTPIALQMAWQGHTEQIFLGVVTLLVLYGIVLFGRDLNAGMREAIELRYQNLDLIGELEAQKADLERARAEAEAANQSKTRFLAAASHDLRQPLHALTLFTAALQSHLYDADGRILAARIGESVRALEGQFNAILDLSKLDAGIVRNEPRPFALASVLNRISAEFGPEAAEKGVELRVPPTRLWLYSDPVHVERVLRNLVSNAVRYTEKGKVLVACRLKGGCVRIQVADTGIGISAGHLPRIWDEFFQVGNPERNRRSGFGLGLATVKRLVRLLRTRVDVTSEPGKGSVFSISLPRAEPVALPSEPAEEVHAPIRQADVGRVVVVVDDEAAVRDATRVVLTQRGYLAIAVPGIDAAFDALGEIGRYPDAVIADLQLADGATGIDAVMQLRRELELDIPALIVTGTTSPKALAQVQAAGLPVLHKPFSAETLITHLNRMLAVGGPT